ncbi:MAG: TetR/AcrR family transcriptional regulator [Myxococcota bacterium]|nr:TetR/AcrR family transcriptional regulator [Myxococcota bacterium]
MPRKPKHNHGREEILRAALRLFAARGFKGTSTAAIAREVGVSQPLIHHHFGSKEALWQAVVEQSFSRMGEGILEAASGHPPGIERLRALLLALVDQLAAQPQAGAILRTESIAGGSHFDFLYENFIAGLVALFHRELQAAVDQGLLRPVSPPVAYSIVIGACTQPFADARLMERYFGTQVDDPTFVQAFREEVVDTLLVGLAPR